MFLILLIFTFFFTFICFCSNNLIIWWSVFLMMTLMFILINKSTKSYVSIFNYFVIQESLGLLFLVFSTGYLQFMVLLLKIGVAPLHFWIFSVTNNVFNYGLLWFLTFQKLPFLLVLLQIFWLGCVLILFIGLLFCYLQMFSLKSYKNLLIISSTESFNWIILGNFLSFFNSLYLFIYYFILMVLLIPKFSIFSQSFINWETVLVFLNIPFSVSFFVKIFSLSEIFKFSDVYFLLILFLMFLSVLSFSFWLINLSMKNNDFFTSNNKFVYFILLPLMSISII